MVAVRAANQAPDVSITSELGSLFLAPAQITDPRWRLDAVVRVVPALHRFNVSLDRVRARVREGAAAAICPAPLRERLIPMLVDALDHGSAGALSDVVAALWSRDWAGASFRAVGAALALGDHEAARAIAGYHHLAASPGRYLKPRLDDLLRRGYVARHGGDHAWPRVVADLRTRCSEEAFEPSLPLLAALVDAIAKHGDAARVEDVERMLPRVLGRDHSIAIAHLARLALRFDGINAARSRVRGIRDKSACAGAMLWLVRESIAIGQLDTARQLAGAIDGRIVLERAYLELARGLFECGRVVDALRTLQLVSDRRLRSERLLLVDEIRLVVRRDRECPLGIRSVLPAARAFAAWMLPASWIDEVARAEIATATMFVRYGMRTSTHCFIVDAARALGRIPHTGAHRAAFLRLAECAGVDLEVALLEMHCASDRSSLDPFLAEHVARTAERLASPHNELPWPMAQGLSGCASIAITDASTIERALFDEGLALSNAAPQRRRVLIATAQHCLRSALTEPARWTSEVINARLRTLVHLRGALGRDAIVKALTTLPVRRETSMTAIEALCHLDARIAGTIVLDRLRELREAGVDITRALQHVERHGGLPRGFARVFSHARAAIDAQLASIDADVWLIGFLRYWRERSGSLPSVPVLESIAEHDELPSTPIELLNELVSAGDVLHGDSHVAVAMRVASGPGVLGQLVLCQPARVYDGLKIWMLQRWQTLVAAAISKRAATIDDNIVKRFARLLRRPHQADALLLGDLPRIGVVGVTDLAVDGAAFRVRLLDKRLDLLTYLRFADVPARSCYRSDSSYYGAGTQSDSIEVWKDPLSFCFHIERKCGDIYRPCGFLFGSFADVDGKPAVVLNSLHVVPRSAELRERVVRAVENGLCHPLGIELIGIANTHGGRGPLPSNYGQRSVTLTRHRALALGGKPITDVWDDISSEVNSRVNVDHLLWRS